MKSMLYCILITLISCVSMEGQADSDGNPALPKITRTRTGIITYFNALIDRKKIIVGQHCSDNGLLSTDGVYNAYFESLHKSTGKYPALYGNDYGIKSTIRHADVNRLVIKHWQAGGLVTLSWHADCPWVDGYSMRWKSSKNKAIINLSHLTKNAPESTAKSNYRQELLAVGQALKRLKDAGVIVLWRPFHEMNGDWFWWGVADIKNPTNRAEYELLWRDMYTTFTQELELDNLIWIFSANFSCEWTAPVGAMYPGDDVVDIIGVDVYTDVPSLSDYQELKKYNKTIVICEIGPSKKTRGMYDELKIIRTFSGKAAYFLQWHSWEGAKMAIIDNRNYAEMMNDPSAVTLDDMVAAE